MTAVDSTTLLDRPESSSTDGFAVATRQAGWKALYHPSPPPPAVDTTLFSDSYFGWLECRRYVEDFPWLRSAAGFSGCEGLSILEIGSGIGQDLCAFSRHGATVVGVDIDAAVGPIANHWLDRHGRPPAAVTGDALHLPLRDESFDMIFIVDLVGALSALLTPHRFVNELHRVLRPGGEIVIIRSRLRVFAASLDPTTPDVIPTDERSAFYRSRVYHADSDDERQFRPGLQSISLFYAMWRFATRTVPRRIMRRVPPHRRSTVRRLGRPLRWLVEAPFVVVHEIGDVVRRRDATRPVRVGFEKLTDAVRSASAWLSDGSGGTGRSERPEGELVRLVPRAQRMRRLAQRTRPALRLAASVVIVAVMSTLSAIALLTWPIRTGLTRAVHAQRRARLRRKIERSGLLLLDDVDIDRDRTVVRLRRAAASEADRR